MLGRIRSRPKRADAAHLHYVSFAAGFLAVFAFLGALWQIGLSAQMHLAPACTPDDSERLSCTYIGKATVAAVTPDFVFISGLSFQSDVAALPHWADVSYIRTGDPVTAAE